MKRLIKVTDEYDRKWIAVSAMNGILSDPTDLPRLKRKGKKLSCAQSVAVRSVQMADALIKELQR